MRMETEPRRRGRGRSGAQAGNDRRAAATGLRQTAWGQPQLIDAPTCPLDEEGVRAIDDTAMRILEDIGILFLHDEALDILTRAGASVDRDTRTVRMDREMVRAHIALAPASFRITPRNPERAIDIGGHHLAFGNVSSPPNCSDLERGRRSGDRESFRDLVKLTQHFNCIHFNGGYPVEPVDLHASTRHLDCLHDMLTLTDKAVHAYALGPERIEDAMEMVRIAGGLSHEEFDAAPRMFTNINSSSPLKHDWPMLDGAMRLARRGQPVVVSPFTLAGAMAPVTLAGAIAQQTAEALCALVLCQAIRPGLPVVMGSFTSNVDMRSGAPAFGTPEYMRATQMSGQMARFYGLPLRASNACAANAPDAQAAWESGFSLWACNSGRANMVYHSAGWLEGGLCASYEKFVMDCEMLQQVIHYNRPIGVTEGDLALDAIAEVGPSGHFFGAAHTQARYQDAFYEPFLSDWRNYKAWEEAGAVRTPERAMARWKRILAEFEPPEMDLAIAEELAEFVERRRREGGAPTDF
ncbi:trimethylamine methyltransferase family protein [Paroceanicella profunda]|uniref:Methyltransferase n=1 Tax=Paroceanicella profunda TaxID=2579971 RepID=A0A5B8FTU0_9RHOB|nr:trimethylamine methyltransferase family protein [Paroceanicella profunda]QDL90490.1 trimethylamine methyltransferase family protein [Paroceanicella profunda]